MAVFTKSPLPLGLCLENLDLLRLFLFLLLLAGACTPRPTDNTPASGGNSAGLIAFVSTRDGNGEIYVMNADGSDQRRLTNHAGNDYWPSWGRAGSD
jgi:hypothetical protein